MNQLDTFQSLSTQPRALTGYDYIGCYVDSSNRDVADNMGGLSGTGAERALDCANRCSGYAYMGMQWSNECFCDNDYGKYGSAEVGCQDDPSGQLAAWAGDETERAKNELAALTERERELESEVAKRAAVLEAIEGS